MHSPGRAPTDALAHTRAETAGAPREMVAILDYGSQYSRLIARRVRECRVYCELLPAATSLAELRQRGARGVILSGGPDSVYAADARQVDPAILESDLPVLGICYGMHLLAHQLGGRVEPHSGRREYGPAAITLADGVPAAASDGAPAAAAALAQAFFAGIAAPDAGIAVWMSHGDSVGAMPPASSRSRGHATGRWRP